MADIGSTLRETRIRDKIDITTVEEATKIRAKYLRALENEEWGVLPGPAYVKSFLRTYAEFLGLDAHMLVEEYRARFEQPEELELPAFTRDAAAAAAASGAPGPPSRAAVVAALAVGCWSSCSCSASRAGDERRRRIDGLGPEQEPKRPDRSDSRAAGEAEALRRCAQRRKRENVSGLAWSRPATSGSAWSTRRGAAGRGPHGRGGRARGAVQVEALQGHGRKRRR